MRELLRRAWYLIRRRRFDADLREELDFHRASVERELKERGAESIEAHFAARRAIGSVALAQDQARDVWTPRWLQGLGQDVHVAFRSLRSTPVVTAVAVLSLALGIGANSAIFSLIDSLLLRPLPVRAPDRLALLTDASATRYRPAYSYATFDQIRQRGLFDSTAAFSNCCGRSILTFGTEIESVSREFLSGEFFDTLGLHAEMGRLLTPADDVSGGGPDGPVAVISDRLWAERFARAPRAIGSLLRVDQASLTIVGIMPANFLGLEIGQAVDIGMPLHTVLFPGVSPPDGVATYDATATILNIIMRLKPGQTFESVTATLRAIQPQIRAAAPPSALNIDFIKEPFSVEPIGSRMSKLRQQFQGPLLALFAIAALVLTVACANVAHLLVIRVTARWHERSVRAALGAAPWQIARPFVLEALFLAALGTASGVIMAARVPHLLVAELSTATTPLALDLSIDKRVLAFTALAMIATALLAGMTPALRASHAAPLEALRDRTPGGGTRFGTSRGIANGLVVAQVALSLVLVVGAGLFVRTFERLTHVALGVDQARVLDVTVNAQAVPATDRNALYHRLVQAAASVPGVAAAGGSLNAPLIGFLVGDVVVSPPNVPPSPGAERFSQSNFITPGYFAAYGTPLVAGRDFDDRDNKDSQPVMLVNEAFATRVFPQHSAVGSALMLTARTTPFGDDPLGVKTIVGVVGDAVYRSVRDAGQPTIYLPLSQFFVEGGLPHVNLFLAVRTSTTSPALPFRSIAAALSAVSPDVTFTFGTLASQVDDALAQDRLVALLSGSLGMVALLLAALGLFGVTSYIVARRRHEIGIRMALGAAPASIIRLVLSRVSVLVGLGVVAGSIVSLWASKFVASLLYGLEPRDPVTLVGAAVTLAAVAAIAAWIPAWRASHIDPAVVLRNE